MVCSQREPAAIRLRRDLDQGKADTARLNKAKITPDCCTGDWRRHVTRKAYATREDGTHNIGSPPMSFFDLRRAQKKDRLAAVSPSPTNALIKQLA